jgi:hypothetical protein
MIRLDGEHQKEKRAAWTILLTVSAVCRRESSTQLDKEPAVVVCQPDPALHLASQNDQLSERCVLGFKPALRLEWRGQDGQYET